MKLSAVPHIQHGRVKGAVLSAGDDRLFAMGTTLASTDASLPLIALEGFFRPASDPLCPRRIGICPAIVLSPGVPGVSRRQGAVWKSPSKVGPHARAYTHYGECRARTTARPA